MEITKAALSVQVDYHSSPTLSKFGFNLETVIQSEVSQKEKNKYRRLSHICGI